MLIHQLGLQSAHFADDRPFLARHLGNRRSEEHTSELQSLMRTSYAVFCLKKKKTTVETRKAQVSKEQLKHVATNGTTVTSAFRDQEEAEDRIMYEEGKNISAGHAAKKTSTKATQ